MPPPSAAAADARSDRVVSLCMLALSASTAISWGTRRAVGLSVACALINVACAAATTSSHYRGRARVAAAVLPRAVFPVMLQLVVASGRGNAVAVRTLPEFWASRTGPAILFLYGASARLPRRALRRLLAVQAVELAIFQPAACAAIEACYVGITAVMARITAAGAAAVAHAASAVLGVAVGPALAPCPPRTCALTMTWLFASSLLAADAFGAHGEHREPLSRAAGRAAVRAAVAGAALLTTDALLPCGALPVLGAGSMQCTQLVDPPLKRLLVPWRG